MSPPPVKVRAEIGDERRIFTFTAPFRIGRTDECEVCIHNEHVSRKHAEVVFENGCWLVRDLRSANGIFVNGERIESVPLYTGLKIRLGIAGPFVEMLVTQPETAATTGAASSSLAAVPPEPVVKKAAAPLANADKAATHYFGDPNDPSIGEHTRIVRRAFVQVQKKQKRKYGGIIAALVVCAIGVSAYAFYLHRETQKNRALAENIFYAMKEMDVNIA